MNIYAFNMCSELAYSC